VVEVLVVILETRAWLVAQAQVLVDLLMVREQVVMEVLLDQMVIKEMVDQLV
jgi:hypothetical protein